MKTTIILNGKKETVEDRMSVSELLTKKSIKPEVVTVELNEKILEKPEYEKIFLKEGDKIEFVYYMGGGNHAF